MLQDNPSTEIPDAPVEISPPAPALEIANAIARLHKEYVGRGPTNSRTTIDGDLVIAARVGLQEAMRGAMIDIVERALGRRVRSFMSANDLERDLQSEIFVLEGPTTPHAVDEPPVPR